MRSHCEQNTELVTRSTFPHLIRNSYQYFTSYGQSEQRSRVKPHHLLGAAAMALILANNATAHHSFAMFDQTKTLTLNGTVKSWQWTNPHTWLVVTVKDDKGEVQEWNIEGQSPSVLRGEQGYSRDIMKPGDKVIVRIHPRGDGTLGGSLMGVTDPSGKALNQPVQN
jgi:hypothetical protein